MFINIIIIFLTQVNYAMQYKKVKKSSWNEPYSSSSFTKVMQLLLLLLLLETKALGYGTFRTTQLCLRRHNYPQVE